MHYDIRRGHALNVQTHAPQRRGVEEAIKEAKERQAPRERGLLKLKQGKN